MFFRWRRMCEDDRGRVWRLYGWFSGLITCGSCVGAVTWAARRPVFLVTYAIEFLCLSAAKLMVLDRMSDFAASNGNHPSLRRWVAAGRVVIATVVLGSLVGLASNIASAVYYQRASDAARTASTFYAANNTIEGGKWQSLGRKETVLGGSVSSVQSFCEVTVLLFIVAAFHVVGALSARRVSAMLLRVDAASSSAVTGRALWLQIVGTVVFVFFAFVVRSVFSCLHAVSYQLRLFKLDCIGDYCGSCGNLYFHISTWMFFTPEFQLVVVLVSSPLTLLVALWGMTSRSTLNLMKSAEHAAPMSTRTLISMRPFSKRSLPQQLQYTSE